MINGEWSITELTIKLTRVDESIKFLIDSH